MLLAPERLISSSGISRSELRRTLCSIGLSRLVVAPSRFSLSPDSSLAAETDATEVWLLSRSHSVPLSSVMGKFLSPGCSRESPGTGFFAAWADLGGETRIRGASMTVGGEEKVYTRLLSLPYLQLPCQYRMFNNL